MRSSAAIALLGALSLHAGILLLPRANENPTPAAVEITVGLEAGDAGPSSNAPTEATSTAEAEELPEPPELAPAPPTATPPLQETLPVPTPVPPAPMAVTNAPAENPAPPPLPATPQPVTKVISPPAPAQPASSASANRSTAHASKAKNVSEGTGHGSGATGMGSTSVARYLFRSPLRYPNNLWKQRIGGQVVLTVEINEAGRPVSMHVKRSSGHAELDAAALSCARQSIFEPYRIHGQTVPCSMEAPFNFGP